MRLNYCRLVLLGITPKGEAVSDGFYFHNEKEMCRRELQIIDKKLAMDSRDVAKLTHKQHKHVLADIRTMYERLGKPKNGLTYLDKQPI